MTQEKTSTPQPARVNVLQPVSAQPVPQKPNYKKWAVVGILVFFLFSSLLIIPAGKFPGLSHLVRMMGFSAEDAQVMSLARALLTWKENGFSRSRVEGSASLSVFNRSQQPGFNANGPKSGLFDLAAVNASRRARGLRPDGLAGAYVGTEEEDAAAYNGNVNGWSQEAAAAAEKAQKSQEIYFGEDADVARRAVAAQGTNKGSLDTASLHVQSNIVGARKTDWLGAVIDKAASIGIGDLDKELQKASQVGTPLNQLGGKLKAGGKPQQDLARTWILSSAANKAKQLMLKKQLAGAGYMAIEMPKKVYDSMGDSSGLMMRGDEVAVSFEEANSLLLDEDTCRDMGQQANSNLAPKLEESQQLIRQVRNNVPTSCGNGITAWKENLSQVRQNCQTVKDTFSNMKTACGVKVEKEGNCETVYLDSYASDLTAACEALAAAEMEDPRDEDKIAQLKKERDDVIKNFDQGQLDNTFNIGVDGVSGGNDFFPQTENTGWQKSLGDLNRPI